MSKHFQSILTLISITLLASCSSSKKVFDYNNEYRQLARAGLKLGFDIDEDDDRKLMLECASWLGVKYRYGGNNKNGVDCSGLTCNIYRNVYSHSLHRSSFDQYSKDVKKIKRKKLKSGDLVFFATGSSDRVSHVGIYLKDNLFIHASSSRGVVVSDLDQKYYKERWVSGGEVNK